MITDELIRAALGAVYEKTGHLMLVTTDEQIQREMIKETAMLVEEIIVLGASRPQSVFEDSPKA